MRLKVLSVFFSVELYAKESKEILFQNTRVITKMNAVFIITSLLLLFLLFHKKIKGSETWKATVTPLASIIGSGFLIIAPVLKSSFGPYAIWGITALVVFSFFVGEALRFLMKFSLPEKKENIFYRLSEFTLLLAYVISIAFYVKVLSFFSLNALGIQEEWLVRSVSSGVLIFIGAVGFFKGLRFLEELEEWSVNIKLSIIAGFLFALVIFNLRKMSTSVNFSGLHGQLTFDGIRILMGALVVTQGFETSLYLKDKYETNVLVRTMRISQVLSGLIYISFIGLITILFPVMEETSEVAIIALSAVVASFLPMFLVFASQLSQFSAAVADTIGAGGLGEKLLGKKISEKQVYPVVIFFSVLLVWVTSVFEIITIASKAFAFYYLIQVSRAFFLSLELKKQGKSFLFLLLALVLLACIFLGKSIE